MNRFDLVFDANVDNFVNVKVLRYRTLAGVQFKGLIALVTVLREAVCTKSWNKIE